MKFFDGHNDVLSKLIAEKNGDLDLGLKAFRDGEASLAIDLPKSRQGRLFGGFFAIYMPSHDIPLAQVIEQMSQPSYHIALPQPIEHGAAKAQAMKQADLLAEFESDGLVKICRQRADIDLEKNTDEFLAIMHMEGVEAIGPELQELDQFFEMGLRSLGPVWSRENIFGHGVPFAFPASPDIGPGLTKIGKKLVKKCDQQGVLIDLAHLNEAGFWDVAKLSDRPLMATHSNAHALCESSRNLTDQQLKAIAQSGGIVGVNFAVSFLRPDGQKKTDTCLDVIAHHLAHMINIMGEEHVALGSDYDGAVVPEDLSDASKLENLSACFANYGFNHELIEKICFGNWLKFLRASLPQ